MTPGRSKKYFHGAPPRDWEVRTASAWEPQHTETSPITVRQVLDLPAVRRGVPQVLTAPDRLDHTVRWVHAGEVPNIASLLIGGELLLTTGMGVAESRVEQRRFVSALVQRNVAAVVIELGSTFQEVPKALVAQADLLGLPLIALHAEVRFVEITEAIHREIVNHQFVLMRRGEELHARFTDLMLEGADIADVLTALADVINNPVLLEKSGHGVMFHATCMAPSPDVLAAWESSRSRHLGAPNAFEVRVPSGGHETWGRLIALELDSTLDEFDRVAVERAVALIALALLRNRQEEMLSARNHGSFFTDLIDSAMDEPTARDRAHAFGISPQAERLLPLVLAHRSGHVSLADEDESVWAVVAHHLREELARHRVVAITGGEPGKRRILIAIGQLQRHQRDQTIAIVHEATTTIVQRLVRPDPRWTLVAGRVCGSWIELADALADVIEGIPAGLMHHAQGWYDVTQPDLNRVLHELSATSELQSFTRLRLGPLLDHDRQRKMKLLPTLEAFLATGGHKAETARRLHVERQSLYHRLSRIETLLGEDLTSEDTRLGLHLALRALSVSRDSETPEFFPRLSKP